VLMGVTNHQHSDRLLRQADRKRHATSIVPMAIIVSGKRLSPRPDDRVR